MDLCSESSCLRDISYYSHYTKNPINLPIDLVSDKKCDVKGIINWEFLPKDKITNPFHDYDFFFLLEVGILMTKTISKCTLGLFLIRCPRSYALIKSMICLGRRVLIFEKGSFLFYKPNITTSN